MQKLLSVCLITRDEEKNLEKCLKSVASVADEIILVDTGSIDKTTEIAQKYTDKIFHFNWIDDFSAARNYALERATSEFILSIDADEYLQNPNALINVLKSAKSNVGGWLVNVISEHHNKLGQIDKMHSVLLRLFRNHRSIRFSGIIHEQVLDSILSLNYLIENTQITLIHTGYDIDEQSHQTKHNRNLNLLTKALEKQPNNLYLLTHIGKSYGALGKTEQAQAKFLEVVNKSTEVGSYTIEAYNNLAQLYFEQKNYDLSIDFAKKSLSFVPNQQLPQFIIGDSFLAKKEFDKAYYAFQDLLKSIENVDVKSGVIGQFIIPKEKIYFKIGETLSNLNIYDDAIKNFEMGLQYNPKDIFCLLGIVNATLKSKQRDLAKQLFDEIKKIHPNNQLIHQFEQEFFESDVKNEPERIQIQSEDVLISLSMIVKDEEDFLEGCLESVQGIVDEMVIVDTGSKDRTLEIARRYGAKLYHFNWIDDFAAARNESLKHCTGKWILYLDADERLKIDNPIDFREKLRQIPEDIGGINCIIESEHWKLDNESEVHRGGYPRLFRNLGYPQIQFRGRVHEQISPSILENGKSFINSEIKIEHLGYNRERQIMEQKIQRNYRLLLQHVKEEPTNGYAWYQLGQTLAQMKLINEAEEAIKLAIQCGNLSKSVMASASATLSQLSGNKKLFEEALRWADISLENAPEQIYAMHLKAFALLYLNKFEEAEKLFEKILLKQKEKRGMPQSGFDIEIPQDVILKGLEKAKNKNSKI